MNVENENLVWPRGTNPTPGISHLTPQSLCNKRRAKNHPAHASGVSVFFMAIRDYCKWIISFRRIGYENKKEFKKSQRALAASLAKSKSERRRKKNGHDSRVARYSDIFGHLMIPG